MTPPLASPTTIEKLSEHHAHQGDDAFLQQVGRGGLLIRLDERGESDDPAPWAFREGAAPAGLKHTPKQKNPWKELHQEDEDNPEDLDKTEEITDEMGLGFPIPPSKGAATVYVLPNVTQEITLSLGRSIDNELQINERSVSRHHSTITLSPNIDGLHITDIQSRNGVKVRGRLIDTAKPFKAHHGDTIGLGDILFLYLSAEQFIKNIKYFTD